MQSNQRQQTKPKKFETPTNEFIICILLQECGSAFVNGTCMSINREWHKLCFSSFRLYQTLIIICARDQIEWRLAPVAPGVFFCRKMPPLSILNSGYNFPHHPHHHTVTITWHQIFPGCSVNVGEAISFSFKCACMHQFEHLQTLKPNQTNESQLCVRNEFNCGIIHIQTTFFVYILFYFPLNRM